MSRCLLCLRPVSSGERHHAYCARRMFGTDVPPRLDIASAQLQTLALSTIGKSSLAGVQRKISIGLYKERSTLRVETAGGGRFILKPQSTTLPGLPENEHVSMVLARGFGLAVPEVALVELADGDLAYLVARFDRPAGGGKRRQEDFCQLRMLRPNARYDGTGADCAATVRAFSAEPAADLVRLFETFVFAYWIGNGDQHLKNLSLLADAEGRHLLSPAYDQVSTAMYVEFDDDAPALALVERGPKEPRPQDWIDFAQTCGMRPRAVRRLLARPHQRLERAQDIVRQSHLAPSLAERYLAVLERRTRRLDAVLELVA